MLLTPVLNGRPGLEEMLFTKLFVGFFFPVNRNPSVKGMTECLVQQIRN